jgi:Flp pilus assembly protein TadD
VVFYQRGVAEERAHDWPKAKADLEQALKLSPDQPFVLNYLGYSYADMGQNLDEARSMIERAAFRRPDDGAITDSLGWVLLRQGHADQAVKVLERAVELEAEDPTINGHLGDAYDAAGRKVEALFQWRRALTLKPDPEDKAKLDAKLAKAHGGSVPPAGH